MFFCIFCFPPESKNAGYRLDHVQFFAEQPTIISNLDSLDPTLKYLTKIFSCLYSLILEQKFSLVNIQEFEMNNQIHQTSLSQGGKL